MFDPDSCRYRPGKSRHQAIEQTRKRCWDYDWALDLDIKGFFDTIDHALLMRALRKHCREPWVLLYVERWLEAPVEMPDGTIQKREAGTPQGGVVGPLLANLFLHYAFDAWMRRTFPRIPFERYADNAICHCRTRQEAEHLKAVLEKRLADCHLTLHPQKTQVVYCKDSNRRGTHPQIHFTFLGFTFRPRRFYPTEMSKLFTYLDERLGARLRRKYNSLKRHRGRSLRRLNGIAKHNPSFFVHWARLGHATVG